MALATSILTEEDVVVDHASNDSLIMKGATLNDFVHVEKVKLIVIGMLELIDVLSLNVAHSKSFTHHHND